MIDLTLLTEARKRWGGWHYGDWPIPDLGTMDIILAAVDALLEADPTWWCTTHLRNSSHGADCGFDGVRAKDARFRRCRMIRVVGVPVETP